MNKNTPTKMARNRTLHRQQLFKKIFFAGFTVVVLSMAGVFLYNAFYKAPLPAANNVIDVSADMGGFNKQEIRVKVGQPVTIRLRSMDNAYHTDGGGKHQWAVDEFKANVVAPPEGTAMTTFTPTQPGTYIYYCDICCGGRANPSMNGKLVVEG